MLVLGRLVVPEAAVRIGIQAGAMGEAKLWLVPSVSLATTRGYTARELDRIMVIVARNAEVLIDRWLKTCQEMMT